VVSTKDTVYRGILTGAPSDPNWSWTASDVSPDAPLNGVACGAPGQCTAVGFGGEVWTTTDPELLQWTGQIIPPGQTEAKTPGWLGVACPAEGVCLAGANGGYIASTQNNWVDFALEQIPGTPEFPNIKGFGCRTPANCVAFGTTTILTGTRSLT
jgi:hypothetical protein